MKIFIYLFLCIVIILYCICAPAEAFAASQAGILLWFNQLLPTLLPFSIISNLLVCSNLFSVIQRKIQTKFPFHIPIIKVFILFCGFLFGFPIGSKLTVDFYQKGMLTKKEAQILCAFTNNLSPVFISSFVCSAMLYHTNWIIPMYLNVYVPSLLFGVVLLFYTGSSNRHAQTCGTGARRLSDAQKKRPESNFCINMHLLDTGIINSFLILIKLCGYVVIFSIFVQLVSTATWLPSAIRLIATCMLEVTNAAASIAAYPLPDNVLYICTISMLSFGGLCTMAQTGSILSQTDLSLKKYILHRLIITILCTLCATFYQLLLFFVL